MMFNEYMDHANQCAGYYSVARKEEINIQQNETNRFKQKWLEVSGNNYAPPPAPQNPTPPPPLAPQSQYNNRIKQEPNPNQASYMNNGQYSNNQNQYKPGPAPQMKQNNSSTSSNISQIPSNLDNQHMMMKSGQHNMQSGQQKHPSNNQMQYGQQQSKYYEPQFIPNMKDNNTQKQPQKRQSPSPMILNNNTNNNIVNNSNSYGQPQQHNNYENPSKKFGKSLPTSNNTNINNSNNVTNSTLPNNGITNNSNKLPNNMNTVNNNTKNPANLNKMDTNNYNNQPKMYHHNPTMMQPGNNYPVNVQQQNNQVHPNMNQGHPNYKPPFQQQQPQSNYMHHQQQNYHHPQQQQHQKLPVQHNQQHQKPYSNHDYNLELKTAPRVNSPIHNNQSPYPMVHSNGPSDTNNSPKDTWTDSNKRDLVSPNLANSNAFTKKLSSSNLVQTHENQTINKLPIKSPAAPLRSTTPSLISEPAIKIHSENNNLVQKSPNRIMTNSPSNSSLNASICVPTPINNHNLIDLNQNEQLIADDCDSGSSLLSPLNNYKTNIDISNFNNHTTSNNLNFPNSKSSILSEINIDELFIHYPKVFEELFCSFKLNSIEQIEHDLRTYCEQQFKLNFTSKNVTNCSNSNSAQQFSIRI